ncbi:DUF2877 domain-containing protein [Cardiobacteriaceae bacterium TAE3-ERU3]|nr:DUF2877 domain-containing protein [Cardiobacteriaceae bacterium TAE3-ERU3]
MSISCVDQRIIADLPLLQHGWQVVSVHRHVVNLRHDQHSTLLALVDHSVACGPRQLRCQGSLPSHPVVLRRILSQLATNLPTPFDCTLQPPDTTLNPTSLTSAWQYLADTATTPTDTFNQQLQQHLQHTIHTLLNALTDNTPLDPAVQALIGLGHGLTPSGDDFLAGLLIALSLPSSPLAHCRTQLQHSILRHHYRTHPVSAAFLDDAIRVQVSEPVQTCVTALHQNPDTNTATAIQALTNLGHRSGHDILSGLLAGLPHDVAQRALLCPYH